MAKSAFRAALEAATRLRHSKAHPLSDVLVPGRLDRRLLRYVGHFSEWLGAVFGNCPHDDVRHFLAPTAVD
jgi:pyrroloquinoline-quinone synthase